MTLLVFFLVLSVLVLVHEFGHYFTARRLGVNVEEFGLGFPPRIWGKTIGKTLYSINIIPFGGFVRLTGENGPVDRPDAFLAKSIGKRAVILISGVAMNLILAYLLLSIGLAVGLPAALDGAPPNANVRKIQLAIASVSAESPAAASGIKTNEVITAVNGGPATLDSLHAAAETLRPVQLSLKAGRSIKTVNLTPVIDSDKIPRFGLQVITVGIISFPLPQAIIRGAALTWQSIGQIAVGLGDFAAQLFRHRAISPDISGPIGIAVVTGQVLALGPSYLIHFIALLSLSLAFMNVLPIPALDGGRLAFLGLERIRRQAVSHQVEGLVHTVGFYLLLLLIVVVSIRDVERFAVFDIIRSAWRGIIS